MKRRSFFQAVTAFAATCLLPPIRAARAVQSRVRQIKIPTWLSGRKHWEHLPVPVPLPENYFPIRPSDAKIVCRVLGPTHFNTNLHPENGEFERGLDEAGWDPEDIARRVSPNYGEWGKSLPCEACSRRVWLPNEAGPAVLGTSAAASLSFFGWQLEQKAGEWLVRCPDHHVPTA